ncbi:MAG: UbiH/UbiF family hydroxylase [Proteobacteria bacterium]|nr:UbiH/UbiF family hydroxylase [Pseudomonadota bacterium]
MNQDFDVVIVGGGLAGLSLAVALSTSRLSVAVVEGRAPADTVGWDSRIYAVSPANARFLNEIGIWQHFDPSRIAAVQAMEIYGDAGGRLDFSAYDSGVEELAWVIEASLIQRELWETAKRQGNVTLFCPARPQALSLGPERASLGLEDGSSLSARLVVAADGADSWVRQAAGMEVEFKPYQQMGVVANFTCEKPHRNTAFQWFRGDGVLAYLPLAESNMISIVWSTPDDHVGELLALPPEEFCSRVAWAGDMRLGELTLVTPPTGFPLRLMRAPRTVAPRLALIGDAAHAIHPLSGHGINLGFQDARVLAETLAECPDFIDCGDESWLRRYERSRIEEVVALQSATHGLQRLFRPQNAVLTMLRNAGLNLTNALPVVRDALVRYALG